ncbi:MAG TPA: hypothetical protein VJZ26_13895 [Blastocatellia bacterium]|nr:hypothetical protein [Blastocatellia bacterium]
MKTICMAIILSLGLSASALAQKRPKQRPANRRVAAREPASGDNANKPRMIGSQVVIITKNDDRIAGTLLDLTAYSVRIRADNLESTIALDTISSLSFGGSVPVAKPTSVPARADFVREANSVINSFQAIATQLKTGMDFTEYTRQLGDMRRAGEQFTARYGATENPTEARVVALLAGALTDYSWARTIWTLKFGRSGDGALNETDSPFISDTLALYPDLRASAATGNKYSVDKIVSGLWRKAAEQTDRARELIASR